MNAGPISPETLSMWTRDGVRLDADVYWPATADACPVLLMRQPYGRRLASTVCYAHPAWYAAQGYVVVIQDVRGRGTSGGEFILFEHEATDGEDAVAWAATLPGANGRVGMYGFSYQGVTQLLAASRRPPALQAIAPAMIGWNLRGDWAYENDAFCLAANLGWSVQIAAQEARYRGDDAAYAELAEAARGLALGQECHARPDILDRYAALVPHHERWLTTPASDEYWQHIAPAHYADTLTEHGPPALFIGGWYDTHLPGTVAAHDAYAAAGQVETALEIGPWAHFPWGRRIGDRDFGEGAIGDIDRRQIAWFDRHLKGDTPAPAPAPAPAAAMRLFDVGAKRWRSVARWAAKSKPWSLASDGRAALDERAGRLSPHPTDDGAVDRLVHDPWRPVATTGGAFGAIPGPVDRTATDARPDILTYTSEPLSEPLSLIGSVCAELAVIADHPSFDLSCILSVVDEDGKAVHLTEGYRHFAVSPPGTADVSFRPICVTIDVGKRLRLSIAAASFPAYPVNPGTGSSPAQAPVAAADIITLAVSPGACRIMLPVTQDDVA